MSDSADIKAAADRLKNALESLEQSIGPKMAEFSRMEKLAAESENFAEDRSKLAQKLDDAMANEENFRAREEDFQRLAKETTAELDQVIGQVRNVLERD